MADKEKCEKCEYYTISKHEIDDMTTVDRPHGEWEHFEEERVSEYYDEVTREVYRGIRCPFCKHKVGYEVNFCEECGADLRKEGEAE